MHRGTCKYICHHDLVRAGQSLFTLANAPGGQLACHYGASEGTAW